MRDSNGNDHQTSVIGYDFLTDLAVIKINDNLKPITFGKIENVRVGDISLAIGNPLGVGQTITLGIVSATDKEISPEAYSYQRYVQTDAAINPGNSGGPLVNSLGQVIGINTFIFRDYESNRGSVGIGFAIPINFAKKIADELKLKGVIDRRVSIGFSANRILYGENRDQVGLFIDKVDYSDTARNEELYRGDIIVAAEGYKVESLDEIKAVLIKLDLRAGDDIKLTVVRENDLLDVNLTLGEV